MHEVLRIARKELSGFFSSPVAFIFLGAFLLTNLFLFFWVETFFARNIADARPLFEWMPVLLIFLAAAMTMRLWSEERRAGTLESLMTLPVSVLRLTLGKFLAVLAMVAVALALTAPLPVTVALLGPLDWGPVIGAYIATLLLAAAYISIGLFVSARTDNPIVSLIGTVLLCSVFFLLGSDTLGGLFGHRVSEILHLLGSGSRFESITRGVLDLRDLYFYLSIVGVFLALTIFSLERLRWATDTREPARHRRWILATALVVANLLAANLWLQQVGWLRADLTDGRVYSISDASRNYLDQIQEPLLIRGYFSAQTHPLLAPLVPRIRDLLEEYEIAGGGKLVVEMIDPVAEPDLEREAGEKYGIRPVAFQTTSKYQASVVNSYFDILVQYGDQFETLGFPDLIEIKDRGEGELDVRLRNPEYDLTRTIKKVLYGYRGGGDLFEQIDKPIVFQGFISPDDRLPEPLPSLRQDLGAVLDEIAATSEGRFRVEIRDPDAEGGELAGEIEERFGFQPLVLSLLDPVPFWFYMVLDDGAHAVPVPLPEELDKASLRRAIDAAMKRFAPGFLKTVALYTPPQMEGFGAQGPGFNALEDGLQQGLALRKTDLSAGQVPEDADLLLLASPEDLDETQVFAVDQFLMQGGSVIVAASPYHIDLGGRAIAVQPQATGLEEWLSHHGVTIEQALVMDPQNTPFPIPVQRDLGGFVVEEIQTLAYPYFPDVRDDGLDQDSGITSSLGQITLNWSSPVRTDTEQNQGRRLATLIQSSPASWTSGSQDIQPDFERYGLMGFPAGTETGRQPLAIAIEGRFNSYFAGKPSPLLDTGEQEDEDSALQDTDADEPEQAPDPVISSVVATSPASARLIVIGSASFLTDTAISLATEATQTLYTKPIELLQNAIDWSLEDRGLLTLRGRGQYNRLLYPADPGTRVFWEYLNYVLAALGLVLVYWLHRMARQRRLRQYASILTTTGVES